MKGGEKKLMMNWLLRSMTELSSRKWISKITGAFAQSSTSKIFITQFAKTYRIDVTEAAKPINEYRTLNEFFTRQLKEGKRTIDQSNHAVVSPVDALITSCGAIHEGTILNVKGQPYSIAELLADSNEAKHYNNGYYYVLYLSPTDYHRIHSPIQGKIVKRQHIPGKVYPVNHFGLTNMKKVLSRNERLITYIEQENTIVAAVKVGAMNVSSIHYINEKQTLLERGGELAYFAFGSTVVLLLPTDQFIPDPTVTEQLKVKMGQRLGTLKV